VGSKRDLVKILQVDLWKEQRLAQVFPEHGGVKCNASKSQCVWTFDDSLDYE
jgi:hypothetical protein